MLHDLRFYIELHLDANLSIAALVKFSGLNKDKIITGFRTLFGTTVHQFIKQRRLEKAKHYLLQTDKPIKQIAAFVGYSQRNFFAAFLAHHGQTPAAVRRQKDDEQPTLF